MANAVKYILDTNGEKQSVLIPLNKWNDINEKYKKLQNKVKLMTEIKNGILEVKKANAAGEKLQTLKDFLNECSC